MKRRGALISELIFLYLLIDAINLVFFRADLGFASLILSPYWIPVLVVSSRYGLAAGLISGFISAAHVIYFEFGYLPTRNQLEIQTEIRGIVLPIAFILVGIFLGGMRQRFIQDQQRLAEELARVRVSRDVAQRRFQTSEEARKGIEARVAGETATVRTLYEIAMHFETLEEEEILRGFIKAMATHFDVKRCAIFLREGDYFVVRAAGGWSERELAEGKLRASETALDLAYTSGKVVSARLLLELKESLPPDASNYLALFPLFNADGQAYGVVAIEEMSFLALTQSNLELVGLIVDWMTQALANRRRFGRLQRMAIWDERVHLYSASQFREVLGHEFARARLLDQDLSVSILQVVNYSLLQSAERNLVVQTVAALLTRSLSEPILSFVYDFEGVFAVIAPSTSLTLLSGKIVSIQEEFHKMVLERAEEAESGFASHSPYLTGGSVQLTAAIENSGDLEEAALRAAGIEYAVAPDEVEAR